MKILLKKVEQFLVNNTVWITFTVLLFASIVLVNGEAEKTWGNYLFYVFWLSLLFSPALLFSGFRLWLKNRLNKSTFSFLWFFSFVLLPAVVFFIGFENYLPDPNINADKWLILLLAGVVLLAELLTQANDALLNRLPALKWIKNINLEKTILLLMALFSVGVFLINFLVADENTGIPDVDNVFIFLNYSFQFFLLLLVYYGFYWINHYLLINKLFRKKGFIYYVFGFAATLFLLFPLAAEIISWLPIVHEHQMHPSASEHPFSGIHFIIPFFGMLLSTPVILVVQWFKQNSEIANLEKEKSATELSLLKQQINPHFFFNTLNNLYALSLTKDEKTPEVILQLSELMRYVIKRGKEDAVPIREEIKYIEDYVWLQQIRLHKKLRFTFNKEIENRKIKIPPLLFINLVENAFKHGIEPAERNCSLRIDLKSMENKIEFICINSFEETNADGAGTGLANLRRRLELRFPGKHEFYTEKSNQMFKAILKFEV